MPSLVYLLLRQLERIDRRAADVGTLDFNLMRGGEMTVGTVPAERVSKGILGLKRMPTDLIQRVNKDRGYGYVVGGEIGAAVYSKSTEKYDDVANTWTAKADINTTTGSNAGFSLNGYGYTAGGIFSSITTEKYDDVADIWTVKANMNTGRSNLAGFSLNHFGYTLGGWDGSDKRTTEKYDDVANTWTAKADMNNVRQAPAGFSLNFFGYAAGGVGEQSTERYFAFLNIWTTRTNLATSTSAAPGFSLNGYGYTAGGAGPKATTQKYDDVANTWTTKADLNTARQYLAGFSLNGYVYTAGGGLGGYLATTEKYDDVANTWTAKADLNTGREDSAGFSLGDVVLSTDPEIVNQIRRLAVDFDRGTINAITATGRYKSFDNTFSTANPAPHVVVTAIGANVQLKGTPAAGSFQVQLDAAGTAPGYFIAWGMRA